MDRFTVVLVEGEGEVPDVFLFESAEKADEWAAVRGSVIDAFVVMPISDYYANRMIREEIKERKDEERMKEAGL